MTYGATGTGISSPSAQMVATMNAVTQKHIVPTLGDVVMKPSPAFWLMNRNGVHLQGGEIVYPILTLEETTGGAYYGDQLLNTAVQDPVQPANQQYRPYYESSSIPVTDVILNRGEAGVLSIMQLKFQIACASLLQKLSRALWHTSPQNTSIDIDDISSWVKSTTNTIAGIDRTSVTAFQPAANVAATNPTVIADWEKAYQSVVYGYDEPDILLIDQNKMQYFKGLFTQNIRFTDNVQDSEVLEAGFRYHFVYNNCVVMPDRFVPSGEAYILNSKYIYPVFHENDFFTVDPLVKPSNQRVVVALMSVTWQLICPSPRMNVAVTGIVA